MHTHTHAHKAKKPLLAVVSTQFPPLVHHCIRAFDVPQCLAESPHQLRVYLLGLQLAGLKLLALHMLKMRN